MIAFRGMTAYEAQIGRVWVRLLRPRYINRRSIRQLVTVGWEERDEA